MSEFVYYDRDNNEVICVNKSEYNRSWRDRYLEDAGISYKQLEDARGKTVTLQIVGGKYIDKNTDDKNFVEVKDLFFALELTRFIIKLDDGGIDVEFVLNLPSIPIEDKDSEFYVLYVGFRLFPEDFWEHFKDEDGTLICKSKTPTSLYIEVQITPDKQFDDWNSELYSINALITLPCGTVIGTSD